MDSIQQEALLRMFKAGRLQREVPEHALFIEAELAKLKVLDKHDYESFKKIYEQKAATPPEVMPLEEPNATEAVKVEVEAPKEEAPVIEKVEVKTHEPKKAKGKKQS